MGNPDHIKMQSTTGVASVLHLVISLAPGGLERLVVDWTNARNRRYPGTTRICCLDALGEMAGQVVEGDAVLCVEAKRGRFPWDRIAVRRIVDLLPTPHHGRRSPAQQGEGGSPLPASPCVLHAHNLAAWQYAVLAKLQWKTSQQNQKVLTEYTECSKLGKKSKFWIFKLLCKFCSFCLRFLPALSSSPLRLIYTQHGANVTDEIVAVSGATADVMAKAMWLPRKRIKVVVNGVAVGKVETSDHRPQTVDPRAGIRREVRCKLNIPLNAHVIGSVGRLAYVKGCDRLIAAFAELSRLQTTGNNKNMDVQDKQDGASNKSSCKSCLSMLTPSVSDACLLLVGDGPERANLERQAQELGVADRVIFAGYQADPQPYLGAMDCFMLPSRSEGVSVALLEAMGAGVPVVVTDVGANREVVEDGRCGVILPDDERHWPEAITSLITDPAAVTQRTQAAQLRVRTRYSLDATLDGYECLYGGTVFRHVRRCESA